jgi:hypothetical protein
MAGAPLEIEFEAAQVDTGPGATLIAAMRDEMAAQSADSSSTARACPRPPLAS